MIKAPVAVLTSRQSWFYPYAKNFVRTLCAANVRARLFMNHEAVNRNYETVFILSYFRIIPERFLTMHRHNLVVHESALPRGKGWAPFFWQVLEGKKRIPVVLFEAASRIDAGKIYLRDTIRLCGHELHDELRALQAKKTIELCLSFLKKGDRLKPVPQKGKPTHYRRRTPRDSRLDTQKSIARQFNLLRIVDNDAYPAFFVHRGHTFRILIEKMHNV